MFRENAGEALSLIIDETNDDKIDGKLSKITAPTLGIVRGKPHVAGLKVNSAGDVIRQAKPISLSAGGSGFGCWTTSFPAADANENRLCRSPDGCSQGRVGDQSYCARHQRLYYHPRQQRPAAARTGAPMFRISRVKKSALMARAG